MLSEPASILAVSGDQVKLETSRKSACGSCGIKSGCGQYLFNSNREIITLNRGELAADSLAEWSPGTPVTLAMQGSAVASLALLFYLLPLLCLMVATLVVSQLTSHEGWLALAALIGLVVGLGVLPTVLRMHSARIHLTLNAAQASTESQESLT